MEEFGSRWSQRRFVYRNGIAVNNLIHAVLIRQTDQSEHLCVPGRVLAREYSQQTAYDFVLWNFRLEL